MNVRVCVCVCVCVACVPYSLNEDITNATDSNLSNISDCQINTSDGNHEQIFSYRYHEQDVHHIITNTSDGNLSNVSDRQINTQMNTDTKKCTCRIL